VFVCKDIFSEGLTQATCLCVCCILLVVDVDVV